MMKKFHGLRIKYGKICSFPSQSVKDIWKCLDFFSLCFGSFREKQIMLAEEEGFHGGGNQIWLIEVHMIGGSRCLNATEEINQKCVFFLISALDLLPLM